MKIAIAQVNPTVGDLDGNVNRAVRAAEEAVGQGADLVVFPAFFLTGAPIGGLITSSGFIADVRAHLEEFARRCPLLAVVSAPVPVEDEDGDVSILSELLICGPEGLDSIGVPDLAEDGSCPVMELGGERIALLLENHFAEDVRTEGLNVLVEITADAFGEPTAAPAAWGTLGRMQNVAMNSNAWVANANLFGGADAIVCAGNSTVVDPAGHLVHASEIDSEDVYVFDTKDPAHETVDPDDHELSPDEIRWRALVVATRDYLLKNDFSDAVVGVSGGLDSAVVAALAVDALDPSHVHAVLMPGPYTAEESGEDAAELCRNLGISTVEVPIDGPLEALTEALDPACGGQVAGIAAENLQARIRMTYLMTISNTFNWLVLNTGNKSEAAMGFSTLHGDTCGGFAPLGDIYKTDIYDLARWRMSQGTSIPQRCLDKEPSAELYEGAKDSDRIPPYDQLDEVLCDHIEGNLDADELRDEGYDAALVKDVLARVSASEYKRRFEPLAPNIMGRSFADRGWPVTNAWTDRS